MANVVELKVGENPSEADPIIVQVEPGRRETLHGLYSYGSVRHTPDDQETVESEIRHAQREAEEFGCKTIYVRRLTA